MSFANLMPRALAPDPLTEQFVAQVRSLLPERPSAIAHALGENVIRVLAACNVLRGRGLAVAAADGRYHPAGR